MGESWDNHGKGKNVEQTACTPLVKQTVNKSGFK